VTASAMLLDDASVLALLATCAACAKLAEEHTRWGRAASAPLVAMGMAMVLSLLGILPASVAGSSMYDVVWTHLMPLGVTLSLLSTNLRDVIEQSGAVLAAFGVGAVGSVLGTAVAYALVGPSLGPDAWKIAGRVPEAYTVNPRPLTP